MQSPEKSKILIIDGADGFLRSAVCGLFEGPEGVYEPCKHLYEAVGILCDVPAATPTIAVGMAGEFLTENESFFTFLAKRPNILCIALDFAGREYPYPLRQAIWNGQFLICRSPEEMQQALRWALNDSSASKFLPCQPRRQRPLDRAEFEISPEELDALLKPE